MEVDNPIGADGTGGAERVVWVGDRPGIHVLEVRAWGRGTGRYRVTLEALRTASPGDRLRVQAEKAKADADSSYAAGEFVAAVAGYQQALPRFLELGDRSRQADTHFRLGEAQQALREKQQAIREYETALPLYRAAGNRRQLAMTHHKLCFLHNESRARVDRAREHCERALPLWQAVGDRLGLATTSNELGFIYRLLNERQRALISYDRALSAWRELERPGRAAQTLHNRGRLYESLGQREQAVTDLEKALEIRGRIGQPGEIATTLNSLGLAHLEWQETGRARERFEKALAPELATGGLRRGISLIGLGWAVRGVDEGRAEELFRQALAAFRTARSKSWEAQALLALGQLRCAQGRPAPGKKLLAEALALFQAIGDRSGVAESRLALATGESRLGRLQKARDQIEAALEIIEDLRIQVAAGGDQRAYFSATRQDYYDFYVELLMRLDELNPGAGYRAQALAASERTRARSLGQALIEHGSRLWQRIDPVLREEKLKLERQIFAGEHRLRTLQASGTAGRQEPLPSLERRQLDLLRRFDKLQEQIRLASPLFAELTWPRPLDAAGIRERVLDSETLLLEYKLGERRSFGWAVTTEGLTSFELAPRERLESTVERVYGWITDVRRRTSRVRIRQGLAELDRQLLGPVAAEVAAKQRLLIVADGALQYLPFEALPSLSGEHSDAGSTESPAAFPTDVVYLPSASILALQRARRADLEPAPGLLAVVGDPVYSREDPRLRKVPISGPAPASKRAGLRRGDDLALPRLPYAGLEAQAILDLVPGGDTFAALGFDANREALSGLGRYRVLHFATHSDLNAQHGELSRLVLSLFDEEGRAREDGFLFAHEISAMELPVELVVLSACETALGEQIRGEGLVGLTRAFLHAGAARVVVSLWKVDDRATAELMQRFYRHLLQDRWPPPRALREAKNEIRQLRRWSRPYFWAGFVLQGEWRDAELWKLRPPS